MNCKEGAQHITGQITSLLAKIEEPHYAQPLEIFNGSTLGQHFRHILEFYRCLLHGVDAGVVDYAARERDPKIEQSPQAAKQAFQAVLQAIDQLNETQALAVKADFSTQTDVRPQVQSSVGRELMYAYDHALHHLAIIKIGMQLNTPKVELDANLGVAPSTIKHRNGVYTQ